MKSQVDYLNREHEEKLNELQPEPPIKMVIKSVMKKNLFNVGLSTENPPHTK